MGFIALGIIGAFAGSRMSVEEYPDEERPYVGVGIPYASTAPQEIERNVTRPIEEILSTIGGIDRMFSNTRTGRVWVGISLEEGQNMTAKAIEAKELIESIRHRLPDDIRHIQLRGQDDGDEPILSFVISAPNLDEQDAWRLLDARVRMVLERVPGGEFGATVRRRSTLRAHRPRSVALGGPRPRCPRRATPLGGRELLPVRGQHRAGPAGNPGPAIGQVHRLAGHPRSAGARRSHAGRHRGGVVRPAGGGRPAPAERRGCAWRLRL